MFDGTGGLTPEEDNRLSHSSELQWLRAELRHLAQGQAALAAGQATIQAVLVQLQQVVSNAAASGQELFDAPTPRLPRDGDRDAPPLPEEDTADLDQPGAKDCSGQADVNNEDQGGRPQLQSKMTFVDGQRSLANRRLETLQRSIRAAEEKEEERALRKEEKKHCASYIVKQMGSMPKSEFETRLDLIIGGTICLNALFIGVHMDHRDDSPIWVAIDVVFSLLFMSELIIKIYLHGFAGHFRAASNVFDAALILLDLTQLIIEISFPLAAKELDNAPSASLFRVVRLLRLARLARAMKSEWFRSLSEMIHGIIAGMATLAWSFVLFIAVLYVVSLVFREALGRARENSVSEITSLFHNVPRSMLTMYRCSFGDCNTVDGVSIFERVLPVHGPMYVLFYTLVTFVISIVIFNVISAMFVETTMTAASELTHSKRRQRLQDEALLGAKTSVIIQRIIELSGDLELPAKKLSESMDYVAEAEVPMYVIDQAIADPEVQAALVALDISTIDHGRLPEIFDPDNGGTAELADVAMGIRRTTAAPLSWQMLRWASAGYVANHGVATSYAWI